MHASVILSTYNRARYLELSILGYMRQTHRDFELIITDDGSTDDTGAVVQKYKALAPFPIKYLWQENKGFRLAKIRNEGIKASRYDYIIFSDGDCIPKANFIQTHISNSGDNYFLGGGHVRLSKNYSDNLMPEAVSSGEFENQLTDDVLSGLKWKQRKNIFYMLVAKKRRPKFLGLNFSAPKKILYEVNGFDENFVGWGQEDGDMRERLKKLGKKPKSILTQAIVFHLYHKPHSTKADKPNFSYSRRRNIPVRCTHGIEKP
ncbi:MAG: glycosyltransferase [Candidatus Brocadiales bacterium]|nr:glycosyltransferase [Candidatus Bathyanammoxibius amoris]